MKRWLAIAAVVFFFGGGVVALFWFGHLFLTYASSPANLVVERPAAKKLTLGDVAQFNLHGAGFDEQTSISLFATSSDRSAIVGTFPLSGAYTASFRYGDYLYLAKKNGGIQVLDITNRRKPRLLKTYLPGRTVVDIQCHGKTLYFACGKLGVAIMEITADGGLVAVSDLALPSTVWKTHYQDGYLYVAAGAGGLVVFDRHSPEQATPVAAVSSHFSSTFAVVGQYLYHAEGRKIAIYQLESSGNMHQVGALPLTETTHDLAIHRGQLYLATDAGVFLYGLDNPAQPDLIRQWSDLGLAEKLFPRDEHVYVSDSFSGFRMIDPDADQLPELINLNISIRTLTETANYFYVAGVDQGLLIVKKGDFISRGAVETINTAGSVRDVLIHDQRLYIADSAGGLLMKDLTAQDTPYVSLSSRRSESFALLKETLFVAQGRGGVEKFDLSDPSKPLFVALYPGLQAFRLAAEGRYLVTAKGRAGVDLIDVSNVDCPQIVDSLADVHPLDVVLHEQIVYVTSKNAGLLLYAITKEGRLQLLSQVETPFPMNHFDLGIALKVKDGIAYIANGPSGLLLVDVSQPAAPVILSTIALPGVCKGLKIVNQTAYVVSLRGGVSCVDVTDPQNPAVLNTMMIPGLSRGIEVDDDLIYLAHNSMGVTILPLPVVADKVDVVSEQELRVEVPSPNHPGAYSLQVSNPRGSVVLERVVDYSR